MGQAREGLGSQIQFWKWVPNPFCEMGPQSISWSKWDVPHMPHPRTATWSAHTHLRGGAGGGGDFVPSRIRGGTRSEVGKFRGSPWSLCGILGGHTRKCCGVWGFAGSVEPSHRRQFRRRPGILCGKFRGQSEKRDSPHKLDCPQPPPPCVAFRLVVVSLQGPGQSPVLPFACCVGSLRSVGRCGRCSCWCRFRVRGAQRLVCRGCAGCGMVSPLPRWLGKPEPQDTRTHTIDVTNGQQPRQQAAIKEAGLH